MADAGNSRARQTKAEEVVAEELGPSIRWATATMIGATRSQDWLG